MSSVEEIKAAIKKLSLEERAQIAAELCGGEDDEWDRQMKADAAEGKFDAMNADAARAFTEGRTKPLREILGE